MAAARVEKVKLGLAEKGREIRGATVRQRDLQDGRRSATDRATACTGASHRGRERVSPPSLRDWRCCAVCTGRMREVRQEALRQPGAAVDSAV